MEQIEIFEPGEIFLLQFTNKNGELLPTSSLKFEQWTYNTKTWDISNLVK